MNFLKKILPKLILITFLVVMPIVSFAQTPSKPPGDITPSNPDAGKIMNPIKVDSIAGLIEVLLKGAIKLGIPLVALAIIYCGFLFVAARGSSEKLTKAKEALLYTLIGAAILLGSYAIAELISATVAGLGA